MVDASRGGSGSATDAIVPARSIIRVKKIPVDAPTPDGTCDAVVVAPEDGHACPAIVMFPDVVGLRPAKIEMASRLAAAGFVVLLVNQFYRVRRAPLFSDSFSMANPGDFAAAMELFATLDATLIARDAAAFVDFLAAWPQVRTQSLMGAIGFCMGGAMAIRTAATAPRRVGAVVSLHGGGLVDDKPDSPHRLLGTTRAAYYIGIAADDDARRPRDKAVLVAAFRRASLAGKVEVYPDGNHGWMVPDARAYAPAAAERGWTQLLATFEGSLI